MNFIVAACVLASLCSTSAFDDSLHEGVPKIDRLGAPVPRQESRLKIRSTSRHTQAANLEWVQAGDSILGEAAGDEFGSAVSVSFDGSRIAVGARFNDGNGIDSGNVRVFERNGDQWELLGTSIEGVSPGDRSGMALALAADGSTIAIGAPLNGDQGKPASGHVRVFQYLSGSWIQLGRSIQGEARGDYSGWAVSISDDGMRVAIGAYLNAGAGKSRSGHVRIYDFSEGDWIQLGADINGEAVRDLSGISVDLSGNGMRVAIGATMNNSQGRPNVGHVRVYTYGNDEWSQLGTDLEGQAASDNFGSSVAMSKDGEYIAIGAPSNDRKGSNAGQTQIYQYRSNDTIWSQRGPDILGEIAGDRDGSSVALSSNGQRVAIGSPQHNGKSGQVRLYEYSNGAWNQLGSSVEGESPDDNSGWSIVLSGDGMHVVIGAQTNSANGSKSGNVRVFTLSGSVSVPTTLSPVSPTLLPSAEPETEPSMAPLDVQPSAAPASTEPTEQLSVAPVQAPNSRSPTAKPSLPLSPSRTNDPTGGPTMTPFALPSDFPLIAPPIVGLDVPVCPESTKCTSIGNGTRMHFKIAGFCVQACVIFILPGHMLDVGWSCGVCN